MADNSGVPYKAPDPVEVAEVLQGLNAMVKSTGYKNARTRKKAYHFKEGDDRTVDSWSMMDHAYKKPNLPTYARGLFTRVNENLDPEITVRGYNKFFNVDEVPETKWQNIQENTRGPYELSVKENGCIIFIAGVDNETLIVTSKHSTGPRKDTTVNHALVGEAWIDKQLASVGRTRADLAKRLRSMNATAVAELCDDEFEEHVLEYSPDAAGLYLHGINLNTPEFATYPSVLVDQFADEWAFKKTMYLVENDIGKVKNFLDQVAETGNYAGRDTEGFVIRCQARQGPNKPWHDWFFKYKFEEPYLMYRQWRECTKAVIVGKPPRVRKHKKITEEYLLFVRRKLHQDPALIKRYMQNHGIIAMRDAFLAEKGLKGSDIIHQERVEGGYIDANNVTKDVLLVPIATLGCGKTTLGLAMQKLFGWGHEQNDNIEGKQGRPQRFAMAVTTSMMLHPVVYADRNNHLKQERDQIIQDVQDVVPDARFVAIHYVHGGEVEDIRRATVERVLARGDNHQTIQAGSESQHKIISIVNGFLDRFQPLDTEIPPDDAFELVINLDPTAPSRDNLEIVLRALHDKYPKLFTFPSADQMDQAIEEAIRGYRPELKHDLGPTKKDNKGRDSKKGQQAKLPVAKPKVQTPEYFSIGLPTVDIMSALESVFETRGAQKDQEASRFYKQLRTSRRIPFEFHVTLIHRAAIAEHTEYWDELQSAWERREDALARGQDPTTETNTSKDPKVLGACKVQLERVVWDNEVMCMVARLVDGSENGWRTVNETAHVTIGTASKAIKPKESNDLLRRWLAGDHKSFTAQIRDARIPQAPVLDGVVKVVMRR